MRLEELTPEAVHARGQLGFGQPRAIRVARDGRRIALLRSPDPLTSEQGLWLLERTADGWSERRVDAAAGSSGESAAAAALRERMRELAGGVVAFTADANLTTLVFPAGGALWCARGEDVAPLAGTDGAEAPLLSPDGARLAYIAGRTLRVVEIDQPAVSLAAIEPLGDAELVGRPDFISAEELHRFTGMWWDPESRLLLFQRTDESPVPEVVISNPGDPLAEPARMRYPLANGPNAVVALEIVDVEDGERRAVSWDGDRYPYLCRATWTAAGGLTIDVETRDQRELVTLRVDPPSGTTSPLATLTDAHWVEPGNGTLEHGPGGEPLQLADVDGERVVRLGERILCRGALAIHATCDTGALVEVAPTPVDRRIALARWDGEVEWLSDEQGVAHGWAGGDTIVIEQRSLDTARPRVRAGDHEIASDAEPLEWDERVELFLDLGGEVSSAALLLPLGHDGGPLPVILDPYGGPGFARVQRDRRAFVHARWLAEHGYAVLAIDGPGVPGRSPAWERLIAGDFTRTLDAQLEGLRAVAERRPDVIDLDAVGIRGWSFGGWLSALAAIRRPDLIRAASVGAPVSDWTLYDTHYTERFLGHGEAFEAAAEANSLAGAIDADRPPSPMLILHGFEDDNVLVAHSIRLAEALTRHAIPHGSILLPSLTHIGRTPALARLQRIELEFFDRHLRR
jgi:dipeptidyl-peptidase-4